MSFACRSLFLVHLLVGSALAVGLPSRLATAQDMPLQVGTAEIPFNPARPDDRRVGRLLWRGGVVFSASAPEFGGWSGGVWVG